MTERVTRVGVGVLVMLQAYVWPGMVPDAAEVEVVEGK